jgi:hypothetical protein
MKNVILWALLRADNLSDDELTEEINELERGKNNLPTGIKIWAPVFLNVFRIVREERKNNRKIEIRRRKVLREVFD